MDNTVKYISSLTPLRGIAAFLVILFHYEAFLTFEGFSRTIDLSYSHFIAKGYLWVDFFFVLSGFVITHVYAEKLKKRSSKIVKKYLWARFSRLYPLHFFVMMLFLITIIALNINYPELAERRWNSFFQAKDFIIHLFLLQTSGIIDHFAWNLPSWSIAAEWWTYIIAILIIPFLAKKSLKTSFIVIPFAIMGLVWITFLSPEFNLDVIFGLATFRCIFSFSIGVCIYNIYRFYNQKSTFLEKDFIFYSSLVSIFAIMHFNLYDVIIIPFFALLILCAALNKGTAFKILNAKPLILLGDISYSIYLIHLFWIFMWSLWMNIYFLPANPDFEPSLGHKLIWLFVILIIILVTSYFSYKFIELKAQKKLRKWYSG